jgi:hypothetical protein
MGLCNVTTRKAFFLFLLIFSNSLNGQDYPDLTRQRLQIGISSGADNSQHSAYIVSNLSLHLVSGFTAAIQGFQISTFSNRTLYYVNGLQLSLVSNVSGSKSYRNYKLQDYNVLQGAQIGLLLNKVEGSAVGAQISFFNKVTGYFNGVQTGVFNSANLGGTGLQLGGVLNYAPGRNTLFQVGLINFSNYAGNNSSNIGFLLRDHLQIGLINSTGKNHGYQIGLLNLSKNNQGIPIGLVNTHPSNIIAVLGSNELTNTYFTLGTGSKYIINRLSVGYNYSWNTAVDWTFGYGLEAQFYKQHTIPVFSIYHDFIYLKRRDGQLFGDGLFMSKIGISYANDYIQNFFPILVGATFNIGYFSNEKEGLSLPLIIRDSKNFTIWPGIELGFRI